MRGMKWAGVGVVILLVVAALAAIAALTLKVEQDCRTVYRQGPGFAAPADRMTCSWKIRRR